MLNGEIEYLGINAFLMKPLELRELGSITHDVLAQQAKAA
jgi:hypothetical protein